MAEGVGQAEEETVVGHRRELDRPTGAEAQAPADHYPGDVLARVGIALAELVRPQDRGVVEHRSIPPRLGRRRETGGEVGHFPGIPRVDPGELLLRVDVAVGLMGEIVLPLVDPQPLHVGLADGVGVLERDDAGEIGRERRHEQIDLHPADRRHPVVRLENARLEHRNVVLGNLALGCQVPFEAADEVGVLLEEPPILRRQRGRHAGEILVKLVEHAPQALAVLHAPVEPGEHLIRIVDRRHRLVGTGVHHPRPGIGPVGDEDAELERAEPGGGLRARLEEAGDLLIDRQPARPARRRVASPLDVAGEEFDAGEQAADAAHVAIAVAADLVANAFEGEEAILEGSQGGEDRPQCHGLLAFAGRRGERAGGGWPEVLPHRAVRAEDNDEPLPRRRSACKAGQIAEERRHGRTDPEFPQQFTASDHRSAPGRMERERAGRPPPS